ncbi:hypothetical protein PLAN_30169 [Planktothrix rubescens CCAP 1459/22]|uniref:Uncharacterized protein n=1 Tax=Planktothrix rubescens CCAP 1459/22 TaxID=329571 RepID=A0A6J7ZKQ3_PLARU|nr:hypothetical protein PLAN_30169 [Planktothrix rubescens NIVA-CYA 18]
MLLFWVGTILSQRRNQKKFLLFSESGVISGIYRVGPRIFVKFCKKMREYLIAYLTNFNLQTHIHDLINCWWDWHIGKTGGATRY